jgi:hypothetical protein
MAAIAKTFALESYQSDVMIVDGERAALMSDISYRQRATNASCGCGLPASCAGRTAA